MVKVDSTGQCVPGSGQNDNEAVVRDNSEAFTRWLHHQYAPIKLPLVVNISFHHTIPRFKS